MSRVTKIATCGRTSLKCRDHCMSKRESRGSSELAMWSWAMLNLSSAHSTRMKKACSELSTCCSRSRILPLESEMKLEMAETRPDWSEQETSRVAVVGEVSMWLSVWVKAAEYGDWPLLTYVMNIFT